MSRQGKAKKEGSVIEQVQDFYHQSFRFIQKCSKPNKKGKPANPRVHEDLASLRDRVPRDGFHWLLRQTHLHSHQQHHPRHELFPGRRALRLIITKIPVFCLFIKTRGFMASESIVLKGYEIEFCKGWTLETCIQSVLKG